MATRRVWRHSNGFKWMAIERFNNCENIVALAKELGRYGQFLQRAPNQHRRRRYAMGEARYQAALRPDMKYAMIIKHFPTELLLRPSNLVVME